MDLKHFIRQNKITCSNYFWDILQVARFGFVQIPYIEPIMFQIIEQKLVQRCETHTEAQSCKASNQSATVCSCLETLQLS